jgi:hypothetical protein
VHERQRPVLGRQHRKDVRHRCQHRQPRAPTLLAVQQAKIDALPHRCQGSLLGAENFHQAEHRFGEHQREALLEALSEPAEVVAGRVHLGPQDDEHVLPLDLDAVGADVVGERVERAPRSQVETGMVPVACEQPVLDAPPVEREAHVRATVVHCVRRAVGPKDADGLRADLAGQAPFLLELRRCPNLGPQLRPVH